MNDLEPTYNLMTILDALDMPVASEQADETMTIQYPNSENPAVTIKCGEHTELGKDGYLQVRIGDRIEQRTLKDCLRLILLADEVEETLNKKLEVLKKLHQLVADKDGDTVGS